MILDEEMHNEWYKLYGIMIFHYFYERNHHLSSKFYCIICMKLTQYYNIHKKKKLKMTHLFMLSELIKGATKYKSLYLYTFILFCILSSKFLKKIKICFSLFFRHYYKECIICFKFELSIILLEIVGIPLVDIYITGNICYCCKF